jgi:hypothetical protein
VANRKAGDFGVTDDGQRWPRLPTVRFDFNCRYFTALRRQPAYPVPVGRYQAPEKGHLDAYLKPFIRVAKTDDRLAEEIVQAPGLDGNDEENEVLDKTTEPALKARYEQQELKRRD